MLPQDFFHFLSSETRKIRKWQLTNPRDISQRDKYISPDLLFLMAKAKEDAGLPKDEVTNAYIRAIAMVPYPTKYIGETVSWLYENLEPEMFAEKMRILIRTSDCGDIYAARPADGIKRHIADAATHKLLAFDELQVTVLAKEDLESYRTEVPIRIP